MSLHSYPKGLSVFREDQRPDPADGRNRAYCQSELVVKPFTLTPNYGKIIGPSLTIEPVDKIPWHCHSNETSFTELLHSAIHFFDFEIKIRFFVEIFLGPLCFFYLKDLPGSADALCCHLILNCLCSQQAHLL